ncbi:MAG: hypothetical protein IKJ45_09335 [Kiritimatiellae bacterium]|nr:hypothetical protein [Kiritimatiellia bacterium]
MKLRRILSLVLVFSCLLSLGASADISLEPQFTHTRRISATLSINGNSADCLGAGYPLPSDESRIVRVYVYLQRYESDWVTIETWTDSAIDYTALAGGLKTVTQGYDYQVYVIGTISDAEGVLLELVTKTSSIVSY